MKKPFTLPPRQTWIDHTSVIQTDIDTLYTLLSDIDNWPSWTPGLRSIKRFSRGFAAPGSFFLMTLDAPIIQRLVLPTVMYCNDRHRIEWGGGALGSAIRHFMELTALDGRTTRLRHVEYSTGLLCIGAFPAANFARKHDLRWSRTIEERFNQAGGWREAQRCA